MKYLAIVVCLLLMMPIVSAKQTVSQNRPLTLTAHQTVADVYGDRQSTETLFWDWSTDSLVQFSLKCVETNKTYDFGNNSQMTGSMKLSWGGTWYLLWTNHNNYTVTGHSNSWIDNPNVDDSSSITLAWVLLVIFAFSIFFFTIFLVGRRTLRWQKKKI